MYDFPTPAISGFTFPVVCNAKGGERLGNFWIQRKGSLVVAGKRNRRTGSESNFWVWSRTLSPSVGFEPTSKKGGRTVFAFD
ncbi:hypothetical protein TrVE_jg7620 [Triparma verrucosa]|uniref:Uncharacterized protein n=1 Tax=Triparma verrucosa TaxID=1606542 RepID=A0A9W7C393_9STRA|nr:hypothetical protein TrVE_jg7620 [Triparma verrucosa]